MRSKLLDFFPVPETLGMHSSGLSITDDAVQFVQFAHQNKLELKSFGEVVVPENVMEGGAVADPKALISLLKKIKDQYRLELIDVSIPEEKSYLFKTSVLGDNIKEIQKNIELKIQENVPFKLSEVVFDFNLLRCDAGQTEKEVMVSVLPRTVVEQYLSVFHESGLTPISFQVESQAVTEAAVPDTNKGSVLVVHIKGDKASFYIVTDNIVRFSSTVDIDDSDGGVNILDENLDTQKKSSSNKRNNFNMDILLRETKKILTYWRNHEEGGGSNIEHVYLTGTIIEEIKLTDYISTKIALPVEVSNVWQNAFSFDKTIPNMERGDSLRFAAAIGLALVKEQ